MTCNLVFQLVDHARLLGKDHSNYTNAYELFYNCSNSLLTLNALHSTLIFLQT